MTDTFVRIQHRDLDPQQLLDSSTWKSSVWEGERFRLCPDCNGAGTSENPCDTCCDGWGQNGEVEDIRYGVSTCYDLDDLVTYFDGRDCDHTDAELDELVLVTVEARMAEDDDHDAQDGATLVWPTRIVSVEPIPAELRDVLRTQGCYA
jgi:hypothetical protein